MSTIRYQKRGDKYYAYEVTQYWDKALKKPRQKTKYLGTADKVGGEYNKTGRSPAALKPEQAILDFGDSFAINEIARNMGLTDVLKNSLGDLLDSVMSLVCYQITEGAAMQNCADWSEGNIANKLFPGARTTSQDISRLISTLGQQHIQQKFFKNYVASFFPKKTGLLIDSTALSSAINTSISAFGHTSDGIKENVTCLLLVDKLSKLPIYFRAVGGDINDNSTLQTTIREIKQLGLRTGSAILDAGYCSKENLAYMCKEKINFVTRLPKSHGVFYQLVDEANLTESLDSGVKYDDRSVFVVSKKSVVYGNKMYAHVILDTTKKSKDMSNILKISLDEKQTEDQTSEINRRLKYCGYFVLLSKEKIDRKEILPTYYTRQAIEQIFGFAKSNNSLLPLRVHTEKSINGYLMLVFIALILFVTMRQKLQPDITMGKAMLRLRGLKAKIYENETIIQEPNKKIKDIVKALEIIMPTTLGV